MARKLVDVLEEQGMSLNLKLAVKRRKRWLTAK